MKNDTLVIHQFTPTIASGDGVTNAILFTEKLLKEFGCVTKIYTRRKHFDSTFKHDIFHIDEYVENKNHILLYHHSIGHEYHDIIMNYEDKKILVYHNITPAHFFLKDSEVQKVCKQGRLQIEQSTSYFIGSYADSLYNYEELKFYNYKNPKFLPLLRHTKTMSKIIPTAKIIKKSIDTYNILFVGRIVPNKCQHQLVDVLNVLVQQNIKNIKLIIVGGVLLAEYADFLKNYIKNLGLQNRVLLTGKVSDEDLCAYYTSADLYLSLSEHEGFGIPLLEAMEYDMPVLSYDTGGVSSALGQQGLLNFKAADKVAKKIMEFMENPYKRVEIIKYQKEHLKRFSYKYLKNEFTKYLNTLDIKIPLQDSTKHSSKKKINYQIEGPFDSSYSLAIVNDNLARSFYNASENIKLYSTEGNGDFEPKKEFLKNNIVSNNIYKKELDEIDITIRNLYPPRTNAMKGYHKIIGPYGWEESNFPREHVEGFNRRLSFLTCMSTYVKDVMIKSGVTIPMYVTGIGVDHVLNHKPKKISFSLPHGFKLLHISSAFQRKGIDILLNVFTKLIDTGIDISLVIKTFPNPHNNILQLLEKLPLHVRESISLINEELELSQINYLYENCDCLVSPSRGEGFGLPMAEAMLFDLPVITTGYGGQIDFCKPDNSWLIDYSFRRADTHMNLFNSFWAEPCAKSLEENILNIYHSNQKDIKIKTDCAKTYILENYKWEHVVDRFKKAIEDFDSPKRTIKKRLAWISTYNAKCGIASYSNSLIKLIKNDFESITIFSNIIEQTDILNSKEEKFIRRNWTNRFDIDNQNLIKDLHSNSFTDIVIQFNFSFFSMSNLKQIMKANEDKNITIEFHSVEDVQTKEGMISLKQIQKELKNTHQIIVHNIEALNTLKKFDLVKNVSLLPLGISPISLSTTKENDKLTIATYGFLLPQKGIIELIEAFGYVQKMMPNTHLLLLNSLYPIKLSKQYLKECKEKIVSLNLTANITFIYDYLSSEESARLLANADLLVLAYKETKESASAAIRELIATNKPILCTKQNIFNDVSDIIHFTKGYSPNEIADSIVDLFLNKVKLNSKKEKQQAWISEHNWENISKKFVNIIKKGN